MPKSNHRFLGFDFGTKRLGVAVGEGLTKTASPLPPVSMTHANEPWQRIESLIKEWQPHALVVGIPTKMDGHVLSVTPLAHAFALELAHRFKLRVHEADERLSTKEARQQLFDMGGYKALKKYSIDSYAAKLILEHWLSDEQE